MSVVVDGNVDDLRKARIGYDNILRDASVSSSSSDDDFPADATQLSMTYEKWRPNSVPATLEYEFDLTIVDYVAIGAHDLHDVDGTVELEWWDGDDWVKVPARPPEKTETLVADFSAEQYQLWELAGDSSPIFFLFSPVKTTRIRLTFDGDLEPSIGVVYAGRVLKMQRPIYGGHTPGRLKRKTTYQNNKSEAGQFLGRSIVRKGYEASFDWENIEAAWYRANFEPFVEAARADPCFIAWRPDIFSGEVLYGWTSDDIAPTNSGTRDLMSVSISIEAIG